VVRAPSRKETPRRVSRLWAVGMREWRVRSSSLVPPRR
jgi:hypothetical protein